MENFLASMTDFLNAWPVLKIIWDWVWVIFPLSALFAFAGLDFMSAVCRIRSSVSGRITYNKLGRQIAMLAMILGWMLLAGSRIWLYFRHPSPLSETLEYYVVEISWLLLGLAVLLCSLYFLLWNILKNMPVLLTSIGMISAAQCAFASFAVLASIRIIQNADASGVQELGLGELFAASINAPLWNACLCALPLLFALPGAWSAVWVPARKKKDDFGRDYYNFAIKFCAKWARNAWIALWLMLATFEALRLWKAKGQNSFEEGVVIVAALELLGWLAPLILWNIAARSFVPLRHRSGLFLAFILASCFMLPFFRKLVEI